MAGESEFGDMNVQSQTSPADPDRQLPARPTRRARRSAFYVGLVIVVLSLLSGLATGLILTGLTPIVPKTNVVLTALLINAVLIVAMIGVIAWQITGLWRARRRQAAGSRLHVKIVGLFSIIAVLPAVILAIFASITLDRGLDHWFSTRTKTIIKNSLGVAEAYLQEHGHVLRTDAEAMTRDLDAAQNLAELKELKLSQQAGLRDIAMAYLIDENAEIVATAVQSSNFKYVPPPKSAMTEARLGHIVGIAPGRRNRVAAIKKLRTFPRLYLYVARPVSPVVTRHLRRTQAAVTQYSKLEEGRTGVQIAFGIMYLMIAITMLLAAVWIGLWFAGGLVAPIRHLISAAHRVSEGDLSSEVPIQRGEGDLVQLSATFNRMTSQLRIQRDELVSTNEQLSERRRFMEAVLSGVSAGVLGLDPQGEITITNPSSEALLERDRAELIARPVPRAIPEFGELFAAIESENFKDRVQGQVTLSAKSGERNLAVQITRERGGAVDYGFVVTFDDITELVSAQRISAWADVARRIAHEIKNPLTPIQLSAERLRRKYADSITGDREVFDRCTETIIRRVGDIGRMVDEFSSFARMPEPMMEPHDLCETVREVAFLFQSSHPEMTYNVRLPESPVVAQCDGRLVNQALTNLVKNATEAIAPLLESDDKPDGYAGRIDIVLSVRDDEATIKVIDNGCGLPKKNRRRLVEPYMTTRAKGTGIGLAVVQKVAEQHGGRLRLEDAPEAFDGRRGACIRMRLPLKSSQPADRADGGQAAAGKGGKTDTGETIERVEETGKAGRTNKSGRKSKSKKPAAKVAASRRRGRSAAKA